jgi:Ca-activated chloride channel family protein
MWGQVEETAKIIIAKNVLTDLINELPPELAVGLIAYGHRRKGDCKDVEELVPLGVLDKNKLISKIKELNPKGKTPITHSVQITAAKLKDLEEETTIILVSDGKETCEGDPCALVRELKQKGVRFLMHVIGFDVTDEERNQLECIAEAGGGMYYAAKNAGEFQMAAQKVVKETHTVGFLEITALRNGKPFVARIEVLTPDKAARVTVTNSSNEIDKPVSIRLKPGAYEARVTDTALPNKPSVAFKGIKVEQGKTVTKTAEFAASYLKVTAKKQGKPFRTHVRVFPEGENRYLVMKDTGNDQPALFKLLPGIYDVKVEDFSNHSFKEFRDVIIESHKTIEVTF